MLPDRLPGTVAVILNYKTPDDTVRLVRQLRDEGVPLADILIVDNASADESLTRFARDIPNERVIAATTNEGFSAGCNLGIRAALAGGARRVLLLNSDVVVPAAAVSTLDAALDDDLTLGIVGPMLVTATTPARVESLGIDFTAWSGRMRHRGAGLLASAVRPGRPQPAPCDGVTGCAMLIRRDVFDAIGLLAEPYFFGFEDLDFCLRACQAGFRTACVEHASVVHEGSKAMGRTSPARLYFAVRNHLLLAERCARRRTRWTRALQRGSITGLNLAFAVWRSGIPLRRALTAWARGIGDHRRRVYGAGSWR